MYVFIFDIVKKTLFFTNVVKLDKTATERRLFMSLHGLEILVLKQAKEVEIIYICQCAAEFLSSE